MVTPSRLVATVVLAFAIGAGCGSTVQTDLDQGGTSAAAGLVDLADARVDETWPVQVATEAEIGAWASNAGWVTLVNRRDYAAAVTQLGPTGGLAAARAHADAAATFRQAALLSAHSLIETYGKTPAATDPVGAAHLLTVSYAIVGDIEAAKAQSAKLEGATDPTMAWHAPWKAWLAAGATWPPDLSGLPIGLPEVKVGERPEVGQLPHYALPEQGVDTTREMGDPGALVALALWHDAAAHAAAGAQSGLVDAYRAGYRLPVEADVPAGGPLPMELLFGSDLLVPGDGAFIAELQGAKGLAAVDAHKDTSVLAWLAHASRGADGKIEVEKAVDLITQLRAKIVERSAARTGGTALAHHRPFADIAYVGAFRTIALVAELEGDREVSGLLRINAMERSQKETACPVGLLALAAWDASNRYPSRALEILHAQARVFPSLETARYGLDVMALRVSRERTGETPGM